jgi:hypothetical protein
MEMKCHKSTFAAFAENRGWLELYDKPNNKGSEMGYLLQDGSSLTVYFNQDAEFRALNDVANVCMNADGDDDEGN